MELSIEQINEFNENGLLFVENLFSKDEISELKNRLPDIMNERSEKVLRERSSDSVRSAIAPHLSDELFRRLSLHPRLVEPARTLLGGEVYLHQFKINAKEAHDGEIWHWHQDYRTWYEDDGMPEPTVLNATVFLDDVNEFNGPMMFVPGSHKDGRIDSDQAFERVPEYGRLSADAVGSPYTNETINGLIEKNGIVISIGIGFGKNRFQKKYRYRFRKFFGIGKSIGIGFEKFWYRKKYRYRFRKKIGIKKYESVSKQFG